MLSFTALATDIASADAYASARGWADWTGSDAVKNAALRRGQDYIAGEYNSRWLTEWANEEAPENVRFAIIEAARRELVSPGATAPDINLSEVKTLTGVDKIKWTAAKQNITRSDIETDFTAIERLLSGLVRNGATSFVDRA